MTISARGNGRDGHGVHGGSAVLDDSQQPDGVAREFQGRPAAREDHRRYPAHRGE